MVDEQKYLQKQNFSNWVDIAKNLWKYKKIILKSCIGGAIVGLIIGFSIPKEYSASVTLAPEISGGKSVSGGLSALAGIAGINLGSSSSADALSPELYPNIVKSIPFSIDIMNIKVKSENGDFESTLYKYLKENQKQAWWVYITSFPSKILSWIAGAVKGNEADNSSKNTIDPFWLTPEQSGVINLLRERITVGVDKKTSIIRINVIMQDPLIAATVTNEVKEKLQSYITKYRTNKAKKDLEFTQKLYEENMENYHKTQQEYATYMDRNQNVSLRSAQTHQERLRNEMELAYNVYNQTAQQLQVAKAKLQQDTPVFTVVETATVPLRAYSPAKANIIIGFILIAGIISCAWILYGKSILELFVK